MRQQALEIDDIYLAALEVPAGPARVAFLDKACAANHPLRERVERLLRVQPDVGSFLESAAVPDLANFAPTITGPEVAEVPGMQIGPYKLLEQIGEGGFGIVFMAEQQHPVRRKVALKVLKPGMDTRQVVARFEAERQALALMDHPHIARVLDAGATDSGRPYFVMELVKGVAITEYCDAQRLRPRERLELFMAVCQAVQHAHQKGIIHRDIKPSNVLVTKHDGVPVVKVIDFGVAKALGQQLTDKTLFTGFAQMIGTPLYMSPEQAELSGLDVDTRTDVYSLGVLLYELLTGTTPFAKERLKSAAFDEIRRIIREDEPPKPSTRLSELGRSGQPSLKSSPASAARHGGSSRQAGPTSLASVAALRQTEPRRLSQLVRGDLDWIVMKALEKDRNRRYETASSFALDIQRYLADEAVQACPPSALYRFRKFARRNKASFAIGTAVVTALLIAVVGLAASNALVRKESTAKEVALGEKSDALREKEEALQDARYQERLASQNAAAADEQRGKAAENEVEAKAQTRLARRRFYAAQVILAQQALEAGNTARALELLENHRPRLDEEDPRGFEWYYLWEKCHRGLKTWLTTPAGVTCLAFAPDSRTLAYGGKDGAVTLVDVETGSMIGRLEQPDSVPNALAFSPDQKTLAVATADGAELWDWKAREPLGRVGHRTLTRHLAFFPDGRELALLESNAVSIWNVEQRRIQSTVPVSPDLLYRVVISPDGLSLTTSESRSVTVWRRQGPSWEKLRTHGQLVHDVRSLALSPDGLFLAAGMMHAGDHSRIERVSPQAAAPDEPRLEGIPGERADVKQVWPAFRSPGESGVHVWDAATGEERTQLQGRGVVGWVGPVEFAPHHRLLAVANLHNVLFYDYETGVPRLTSYGSPTHIGPISGLSFAPDGKYLATTATDENVIKIWDSSMPQVPAALKTESGSHFVGLSADEQTLLSGANRITRWDIRSGRETGSWALGEGESVASPLCPNGRLIAIRRPGHVVRAMDVVTGEEVGRTAPMRTPTVFHCSISPDGRFVAVPAHEPLLVWDLAERKPMFVAGEQSQWFSTACSPDGRLIAAGGWFGNVGLFESLQGRLVRHISCGSSWVMALAFTADSRILATANRDGTVKLWNCDDGALVRALGGHGDVVGTMAFAAGDQALATGTLDGTVRLWDLTTGQELLELTGDRSKITGICGAKDGTVLASSSLDGQVRLHHAPRRREATAARKELDSQDPLTPARRLDAADEAWAAGKLEAALAECARAQSRLERLIGRFPDEREYHQQLARSWLIASLVDGSSRGSDGPAIPLRRAAEVYARLGSYEQSSIQDQYLRLAGELDSRKQLDRAEQLYAHLTAFFEQLAANRERVFEFRSRAALAEGRRAAACARAQRRPDALTATQRARDALEKLPVPLATERLAARAQADAWAQIALVYRELEDYSAERQAWNRAVELRPNNPNFWYYRGYSSIQLHDDEEAAHDFSRVIESAPTHSPTWNNRGVAYARLGRLELAAADYARAAELSGTPDTLPWQNLGGVKRQLRQLDAALAAYSKAVDIDPVSSKLRLERGKTFELLERWDEALADFHKAVELEPNDAACHKCLGIALYRTKHFMDAAESCRKAAELAPEDVEAHNALGAALLNTDRPDDGRAALERALEINPDFAEAHYNLGDLHRVQRRLHDALKCYQRALEINPRNAEAQNRLGIVYLAQGQTEKAITCFRRALELDPKSTYAHGNLGAALLKKGQWDEALACFEKAIAVDPNNAAAMTGLATTLLKLGRIEDAIDHFLRAIRMDRSNWQNYVLSRTADSAGRPSENNFNGLVSAYQALAQQESGTGRLTAELARLLVAGGWGCVPETLALWKSQIDPTAAYQSRRLGLGKRLWELADEYAAAGRNDEAEQALHAAKSVFAALSTDFADNDSYRKDLRQAYWKLTLLLKDSGRAEGEAALRDALAYFQNLVEREPDNAEYLEHLAWTDLGLAMLLGRRGLTVEASIEYDNAISGFSRAAEPQPDFAMAWSGRGYARAQLRQWAPAIADYSRAIELAAGKHADYLDRGLAYVNLALFPEAAADLERTVQLQDPLKSIGFLEHVMLRQWVDDRPGYRKACERMQERFSNSTKPEEWHHLTQALSLAREPVVDSSQIVALSERVVADSRTAWNVAYLGIACFRDGQFERAAASLQESLVVDPNWDSASVYSVLAMAQYQLKDVQQATATLEKARLICEQRFEAMLANDVGFWPLPWWDVVRGKLLYDEAYALLHGSPRAENVLYLLVRARALGVIGRIDESLATFLMAARLEPDNIHWRLELRKFVNDRLDQPGRLAAIAKVDRGLVDSRFHPDWSAIRGDWAGALAGMLKRMESNPDDHWAWYQTAPLYAQTGDSDGYRRHCREMLSRFGDASDPSTCARVARACLLFPGSADETRLARRLADRAVTLAPENDTFLAYHELAQALAEYRSGEFAEARKTLDRCLARPALGALYSVAVGQLLQAMACFQQGDVVEARRLFDNAITFCNTQPQLSKGQLLYWDWHEGISMDVLRREAEDLFRPNTAAPR